MTTLNNHTSSKRPQPLAPPKTSQPSYNHDRTETLVACGRQWIEECTGCLQSDRSFIEYLQDGTVLCELVQTLSPGIIRKINRIRNPFAWRENLSFFLGACSKLGLKDSQLFAPEDVIGTTNPSSIHKNKSGDSDQISRKVALTVCYLALDLQSRQDYTGPYIHIGPRTPQPLQLPSEASSSRSSIISNQEDQVFPSSAASVSSSAQSSTVHSPSDLAQSPSGSRTRRVESVTSLITETSSTDIQSYAELVLYLNGSNKEYTHIGKPASTIRLTQSFNKPPTSSSPSNKGSHRIYRTLSDRTATRAPPPGTQQVDRVTANIQGGVAVFKGSGESLEERSESRDCDSVGTTPSEASTVIFRELPSSSRCSSSNFHHTQDDESRPPGGGSYENSPIVVRHSVAGSLKSVVSDSALPVRGYITESRRAREEESLLPAASNSRDESSVANRVNTTIDSTTTTNTDSTATSDELDSVLSEVNTPDLQVSVQGSEVTTADKIAVNSPTGVSDSTVLSNCNGFSDLVGGSSSCELSADFVGVHSRSDHSKEQVTDSSSLDHTPTSVKSGTSGTSEHLLGSNGRKSFEQPLDQDIAQMDSYSMHYQHGSSHFVDSDPIGVNGVRTHGYASNGRKAVYSTPVGGDEVPHHSLTLASDPESPSSCQVSDTRPDINAGASSHHQNFDVTSMASLKNKNITSVHVGGLDMSRVQSDALPHSLLPSMVTCEDGGGGGGGEGVELRSDLPRMLEDAQSMDTASTEETDRLSMTCSPLHALSPQQSDPASPQLGNSMSPQIDSPLAAGERTELPHRFTAEGNRGSPSHAQQAKRPTSAPNRSVSAGNSSPLHSSAHVTSGHAYGKDKRSSLDTERHKRMLNIQENARAALHYSAKRKSSRPEPLLHNEHRRTSTASSENDPSSPAHSNPHQRKSSPSSAVVLHQHDSSGTSDSSATPLNLRQLSIDQTKKASLTQMDEIWRQVEAIGDRPSMRQCHPPLMSRTACADENRNVISSPGSDLDSGMEYRTPFGKKQDSEVIAESDIVISFDDPVDQSTPLRPLPLEVGGAANGVLETPENAGENRPTSFSNHDIDSLLVTLKSLSSNEENEDLKILEDLLKSNTFKKAKHVHDDMRMLLSGRSTPALHRVLPSTQLMRQHLLHHTEHSDEVDELRSLLRSPHLQAVLFCHDKISSHDLYVPDANFHRTAHDPVDIILSASFDNFQAALPSSSHHRNVASSRDVPFNRKEGATIVYLERTNRPLGCTIYKQEDSVFVGKLLKGCDAEASDMLREGDELLEVNGIPVTGMRTDEVIRLMSGDAQPGTSLVFTIIPVHDESYDIDYEPKHMRAHFDYDGSLDGEIPCKALGLSFLKGDIMEIVNQDDPDWWQACKVFDENAISLPGLIPSMHLQQQREALVHSYAYSSSSDGAKKGIKGIFSRKKKKKIYYQNASPSNVLGVGDEIATYEQVVQLDPDPSLCRPIVLVGAPGVGRRTLIRKLLNSDPSLYHPVVQHSTRMPRPGEINGHDYHFVTKEEFERDIEQERFLEYEELKSHFYGTAFSSIKRVMEGGHVPVLHLHPQALKKIRHSGLRPYIVFVGSPRLERLQLTRKIGSDKMKRRHSTSPHHHVESDNIYTEADLHHLVKESHQIEKQYGHYFDWIIVNDDFQVAADMLKEVSRRLEMEPQWVPYLWKSF